MGLTPTETIEQEYRRLLDEHTDLHTHIRKADNVATETTERYQAVRERLREILSAPPKGYVLPKAARDLLAHAQAHGWMTGVQWTPPGWEDEIYVKVRVGRRMTAQDTGNKYTKSDRYLFELTFHSRGCPPGVLHKFGAGLAETPESARMTAAPSIKKIRDLITSHPVKAAHRTTSEES
ncbi:hypothetical protein ACFCY8_11300 [Streptomyces noursei]|uniref:hypothetical protein n=1 Tax=Streptomyces noursei TaxID=1971 RepID=UPI0035DC1593